MESKWFFLYTVLVLFNYTITQQTSEIPKTIPTTDTTTNTTTTTTTTTTTILITTTFISTSTITTDSTTTTTTTTPPPTTPPPTTPPPTTPPPPPTTTTTTKPTDNTTKANKSLQGWEIALICIFTILPVIVVTILIILCMYRKYKKIKKIKKPIKIKENDKKNIETHSVTLTIHSNIEVEDIYKENIIDEWIKKHANSDLIFREEFQELPDHRNKIKSEHSEKNLSKNRFIDINAYDETRVILENNVWMNGVNCDYINANFIPGYSNNKKFIATQGPLKTTLGDFWHMIWQYRVHAIVMLTNLIENSKEKCTQYWPDNINDPSIYGNIEVTLKETIDTCDFIKRTFFIKPVKTLKSNQSIKIKDELFNEKDFKMLVVTQYFYPEWPDRDTPTTDAMSLLNLVLDVNKNHPSHHSNHPIVVHCSAGVGRTGTYITLDAMFEQLKKESKFNAFNFIKQIRENRCCLVQTLSQYVYIHKSLYEFCLFGLTAVKPIEFPKYYKQSTKNPSDLKKEFDNIRMHHNYSSKKHTKEAFKSENKNKNRNINIVCYDYNRIKLSSMYGDTYINASYISGFNENNKFIITQDPMQNTIFEFWKMISEYNCQIIVCLNKDYLNSEETLYFPLDDENTKIFELEDLKFCISLIDNNNNDYDDPLLSTDTRQQQQQQQLNDKIIKKEYEIIETKHSNTNKFRITQFIFNENWIEDQSPNDCSTFLQLVGQVQKLHSKLEKRPIVVHSNGGGSNCSVFCALSILIDQFKNDQYVDVCRTVKRLRSQRSHMIESFEQYNFLYECLVEFVGSFGLLSCQSSSFDRFSTSSSSNRASLGRASQQNQSNEEISVQF